MKLINKKALDPFHCCCVWVGWLAGCLAWRRIVELEVALNEHHQPASQPNNNVCGLISMKCTANSTSESRKLYAHSSSWAAAPAIPPTTARIMSWCGMHFRGIKINDIPWTRLLFLCVMFLLKRNPSAHTLVMPLCGLVNEGHANRKSMITQHANMILSIN